MREVTSYQSGGIPTWETAIAGGSGADDETEAQVQNPWETRYSMRVDLLATWAYILGPVSGAHSCPTRRWGADGANATLHTAFCLLIIETHNDFVRFHGTSVPIGLLCCSTQVTIYSISISVADYSPSSSENTRISLTAIPRLANSSNCAARCFYKLHGVCLTQNTFNIALIARIRFQAHAGASRNGLSRFHVPFIGPLAERWLDEE